MKTLRRKHTGKDVYTSALERVEYIFKRFDNVVVSFSGGKDSTVVLNLCLEVARKMNRLPLKVVFFDEEVIHPPTIEYVTRVSENKDLDFKWYCVPVQHRNACSRKSPYWYSWNPKKKDVWVRDLPEDGLTYLKGFKIGMNVSDAFNFTFPEMKGTKTQVLGIRTEESIRRLRAVSMREEDNYITLKHGTGWAKSYPIYDWSSNDVWLPVNKFDWDYNRTYDILMRYGKTALQQRVCPPFGEEPLRGISMYHECFPELYFKMLKRVPGVGTAIRYSNTDLYSVNLQEPPMGMTYREYTNVILELYPEKDREMIKKRINQCIRIHNTKSILPITDQDYDPITGCAWKFLCKLALRGDYKGRWMSVMTRESWKVLNKQGMTLEDAIKKWGTNEFRKEFFQKRATDNYDPLDFEGELETE